MYKGDQSPVMKVERMWKVFTFLLVIGCFFVNNTFAVEYRAFNAYGNNIENPEWVIPGAVNIRETPYTNYADGVGEINTNLVPVREISNILFSQEPDIDHINLNDIHVLYGQFICHDIQHTGENPNDIFKIPIPAGDPYFDPYSEGDKYMIFHRGMYANDTGVTTPREFPNLITGIIDLSQVYGSDNATATALRNDTHPEYLKVSYSKNGEILLPINDFGLKMDNNAHVVPDFELFAAGDVRANENNILTCLHTIYLREHNRLVNQFKASHPTWDSETLYQEARRWNIAYYQNTVFGEYVPATIGNPLPLWKAYNSSLNPQPTNFFTTVAFRYGHSETNAVVQRISNSGVILEPVVLRESYFNPRVIKQYGVDDYFRGAAVQTQQTVDVIYVDDLRNFLFGLPGSGGVDLASFNMQRGRDRGAPFYNDAREAWGMPRVNSFSEITNNTALASLLTDIFGSPDNCDAYVCCLAEDHPTLTNPVGPLFTTVINQTYQALRDGDRFYFENSDAGFSASEIQSIKATTFSDIVLRNSNISSFPCSAFYVSASCGNTSNPSNSNNSAEFLNGDVVITWEIIDTTITWTVTAQTEGWVGFGLAGDPGSMLNADVMVGYVDGSDISIGDYLITDREEGCPGVCPDIQQGGKDNLVLVSGSENNGVTVITYSRVFDTGDSKDVAIVEGEDSAIVVAMSDSNSDNLSYHGGNKEAGTINFFTGTSTVTAVDSDNGPNDRLTIHGVFMFFAWAVLFPLGIFVVRFGKRILLKWWFRLHMLIQYLGVLFIIVALILAVEAVASGGIYKHIHSAHAILGVIAVSLSIITPALGQITSLLWANTRKSVPIFPDRVHFVIGYLSPILGYVTIFFGLQRKSAAWWWYLLVALWLAFVGLSFFILLIIQFILNARRKSKNRKLASQAAAQPQAADEEDEDWDDDE